LQTGTDKNSGILLIFYTPSTEMYNVKT